MKKGKFKWSEKKALMACRYMEKIMKLMNINSCLIKSISYKSLLNNIGWDAVMLIGVEGKRDLYSHSWVESSIISLGKPSKPMKVIRKID